MGLVDLSYGPFGLPFMGHVATIPTVSVTREGRIHGELLLLAPGQHAQLHGSNRRLGVV